MEKITIRSKDMECYIIENDVERKAELEDIIPLLGDMGIQYLFSQYFLREVNDIISLSYTLAFMRDDVKSMIYRNLFKRIRGRIEKEVNNIESECKQEDRYIKNRKNKLISFITEYRSTSLLYDKPLVWKEQEPQKEEEIKIQTEEPHDYVEKFKNKIESAFSSGELYLLNCMELEESIQNAFAAFKGKQHELKKIRSLTIETKYLLAASLLFEAGEIKKLNIIGEFSGTWSEFLENCNTLTSIDVSIWKGLTEIPAWIRNAVSLETLSIQSADITCIPDWICNLQSLTKLHIECNSNNLRTISENIGNLKNLVKLSINNSAIDKVPDSIGNLGNLTELSIEYNKNLKSLPDTIGNLKKIDRVEPLRFRH